MIKFFNKYKILSNCQFGFRAGLSTEDALMKFCNNLYGSLNSKKISAALFIDITKAFDTVDHKILLNKLYKCGFRGTMYKWFSSYLSNRVQKVKIGKYFSSFTKINIGVPQGSVLGPILFLVFLNSIFSHNFMGKTIAFADDMAYTYSCDSSVNATLEINHDLETLRHWFKTHKLVLSDKTKIMFFNAGGKESQLADFTFHGALCEKYFFCREICGSSNPLCSYIESGRCSLQCFTIDCVKNFKYLGLLIDSKLNWYDHTAAMKKYLLAAARQLYHLRKFCTTKLTTCIYYGLFHSKLEYGLACWGGTHNNKINPLLILQKQVIRIIYKKRRSESSLPLFRKSNILPLKHLYYFKVLKLFYIKSGYLINTRCHRNYGLRINSLNLALVPAHSLQHFLRSYESIAPRIFNRLPHNIRCLRNEHAFLKEVKSWLFYFLYDSINVLIEVLL